MQNTNITQIDDRKQFIEHCKRNSDSIIAALEFLMKEIKDKFLDRNTSERDLSRLKKEYNHIEDIVYDVHQSTIDVNKSIFTQEV